MQPLPPSPAFTRMRAWSRNNMSWGPSVLATLCRGRAYPARAPGRTRKEILLDGVDADELTQMAAVLELHHAGYFGEQRVVLAPADVEARFELGTALPHDDRTAGNQLAAKHLNSQPLRVGVAPVLGTPKSFFAPYVTYAR